MRRVSFLLDDELFQEIERLRNGMEVRPTLTEILRHLIRKGLKNVES